MEFSLDDEIALAAHNLQRRRADLVFIQEEIDRYESKLVHLLEAKKRKTVEVNGTRFTVVRREIVRWNEPGLKRALGARVFNKLTTAKLDTKKLDAAIAAHQVDPLQVVAYGEVVPGKTYVKVTEVKSDGAE